MKRISIIAATATVLGLTLPTGTDAQEMRPDNTVSELRELVVGPTKSDEDGELVRAFLDSDGVVDVAHDRGIDLERVKERIRTLEEDELADLADRVRQETQQDPNLVGGDTFVISSTAVIIALLVVILIVVS
jgi:hypothetical protein